MARHTTCEQVMKADVECIPETESVQHAAERMRDLNIGFLPICDAKRRVVGTVTDRDIAVRLVADNRPATAPVREVMTREIVACRPTESIERAEALMADRHKSRLMVIDENDQLKGVISLSDLVLQLDDRRAAEALREIATREARA
jgi:CBS domain-containing protein